jgi:acyl carrier protein
MEASGFMELEKTIRTFITTNFYVAEGTPLLVDSSLLDTGVIDSTGVLEVISFLETEFGIQVADAEMVPDNLDSIGSLVAFVERKRGAA